MPLRDILLALIVTAIWGFNFVVIKWGVAEVPPLFLSVLRFLASFLPVIFFVPRPRSSLGVVALYGFVMGSLQFGLLFIAMKLGFSASLASIVTQVQIFFTMGLAALLLGDVPKRTQVAGAAIAFAGIALITTERWSPQELLPFGLAVASAFCLAVSNIIAKRARETRPFSFVIWSSLFAWPPLLLLSLLSEDHAALWRILTNPSSQAIGSVVYLAWGSTLMGYGLWNVLLSRHPAATVAPFYLLVPVFGIASGVLVMGDAFTAPIAWGALLVFAGLLLNVLGPRILQR